MSWHPEDDEDLTEDWGESLDDAGADFYEDRIVDVQDQVERHIEAEEQLHQYDDEHDYGHRWRSEYDIVGESERLQGCHLAVGGHIEVRRARWSRFPGP